jgi:hypothetical protein
MAGEFLLEIVVDVDAAHSRRRLGVEHAQLAERGRRARI